MCRKCFFDYVIHRKSKKIPYSGLTYTALTGVSVEEREKAVLVSAHYASGSGRARGMGEECAYPGVGSVHTRG